MKSPQRCPRVIFFDVNETLLDLRPLEKSVGGALGGREDLVPLWFSTMLHHSLVETLTGTHHPFPEIGVAALRMVAESHRIDLDGEKAREAIVPVITNLPPHPDVIDGLKNLKAQGFKIASLTNSSEDGVEKQFQNAGLIDLFDRLLSVEGIGKFKPHQDVYLWALKQLDVVAAESMLVAAHGWDIAGAACAGLQTTFVARPGKLLYPLAPKPDHIVKNLGELSQLMREQTG